MTMDSTRKSYSRKGRKVKKCHERGRWLSPAARHTGSSSLKTSPHTTSEAMAPGSLWWFQVTVAEDSLSSDSLASQTRTPHCRHTAALLRTATSAPRDGTWCPVVSPRWTMEYFPTLRTAGISVGGGVIGMDRSHAGCSLLRCDRLRCAQQRRRRRGE